MAILSKQEECVATAITQIGYCNPFLPARLELERQALAWSRRDFPQNG